MQAMKNSLQKWLEFMEENENDAMNRLQDCGMISDNCVSAKDVAECDCKDAIAFLEGRNP
jgi:hypothetical protein